MEDRLIQTVTSDRPRRHELAPRRNRWAPPLLAAAAVIAVIALGIAIGTSRHSDGTRPATRLPTVAPTHNATPDTAATTEAPASTPTKPPRTTPTQLRRATNTTSVTPPPAIGRWTGHDLVLTERSLGAVKRGMTPQQAEAAAGVPLTNIGDGIYRPTDTGIGGSTSIRFGWATTCFDATRTHTGTGTRITTAAGVALGDPMTRIVTAYGASATPFTADPNWTGPGNIPAGVLVRFNDGVLLFVGTSADKRGGTISSIRGAPDARTASSLLC
jgi:hypothetical protein